MNNHNPYFKFLKDEALLFILIFTIVIVGNSVLGAIGDIIASPEGNPDEFIRYVSQAGVAGLMCFIYGVLSSSKTFSGAMTIRGNRKDFFKALMIWSIIISLFLAIFSVAIEASYKVILETLLNKEVRIVSDIAWFNIDTTNMELSVVNISLIWFIKTIVSRFMTNVLMISFGCMLGAIEYRLKLKTRIMVFIIMPVLVIGYIVRACVKNEQLIYDILEKATTIIVYFIENPMVSLLGKIVCVGIFTLIGVKFLIKAPIKDYANDLI